MISVMLPTRGRPALCLESAQSLIQRAARPGDIEIILRRDRDDDTAYDPIPQSRLIFGTPLGYAGLRDYYDACAAASRGEWLVVWNDDSTMLTEHWDAELHNAHDAWILFPHKFFPAISRRWYEATGRVAASPHVDTFVAYVTESLVTRGALAPVDDRERWHIHHKCDELDDEGSERRRREILGLQGTSAKFFTAEMRREIELDARKIASAISRRSAR